MAENLDALGPLVTAGGGHHARAWRQHRLVLVVQADNDRGYPLVQFVE